MVSKSVETASNLPMFLLLLPFLGSGFVTTESMPADLRRFAENQPFAPTGLFQIGEIAHFPCKRAPRGTRRGTAYVERMAAVAAQ